MLTLLLVPVESSPSPAGGAPSKAPGPWIRHLARGGASIPPAATPAPGTNPASVPATNDDPLARTREAAVSKAEEALGILSQQQRIETTRRCVLPNNTTTGNHHNTHRHIRPRLRLRPPVLTLTNNIITTTAHTTIPPLHQFRRPTPSTTTASHLR